VFVTVSLSLAGLLGSVSALQGEAESSCMMDTSEAPGGLQGESASESQGSTQDPGKHTHT